MANWSLARTYGHDGFRNGSNFHFWRRSAAVPAASLDGVSPFEAIRSGTPRELAGEDARATPK